MKTNSRDVGVRGRGPRPWCNHKRSQVFYRLEETKDVLRLREEPAVELLMKAGGLRLVETGECLECEEEKAPGRNRWHA